MRIYFAFTDVEIFEIIWENRKSKNQLLCPRKVFFLQKVNQLMLLVAMPQPDATLL